MAVTYLYRPLPPPHRQAYYHFFLVLFHPDRITLQIPWFRRQLTRLYNCTATNRLPFKPTKLLLLLLRLLLLSQPPPSSSSCLSKVPRVRESLEHAIPFHSSIHSSWSFPRPNWIIIISIDGEGRSRSRSISDIFLFAELFNWTSVGGLFTANTGTTSQSPSYAEEEEAGRGRTIVGFRMCSCHLNIVFRLMWIMLSSPKTLFDVPLAVEWQKILQSQLTIFHSAEGRQ